jgi:hypothetical protein
MLAFLPQPNVVLAAGLKPLLRVVMAMPQGDIESRRVCMSLSWAPEWGFPLLVEWSMSLGAPQLTLIVGAWQFPCNKA